MIRKELLELLHEAASIKRWNDHITPPNGFTELDKQAHKMVFAYVIAKMEEMYNRSSINWRDLIEGAIFEFIHRIKLTDIKPPIFHKLMQSKGVELNKWVLQEVEPLMVNLDPDNNIFDRFSKYLLDNRHCKHEKKVLRAAHYLATHWEFEIIYTLNSTLYGLENTKRQIVDEIEEHYDLIGVQKIWLRKKTHAFLDLVGQLRFQKRWAQTPRIPETSVLGHMYVVALLAYFFSLTFRACDKRAYNNFFGGLFHDLPEVLTRDIVSPVKRSITGLEEILKEIEQLQIEERLLPLLPNSWHPEIRYFIEDEFTSKILDEQGTIKHVTSDQINTSFNHDKYCPIDGELIKSCDKLAAYLEAALSIKHGIKSTHLLSGYNSLYQEQKNLKVAGLEIGPIYDYFMT